MSKPIKLESGAIYTKNEIESDVDVSIDFIANSGVDQNDEFSFADMQEIVRREFPRVAPKNIRIFAHSCAGMQLSRKHR